MKKRIFLLIIFFVSCTQKKLREVPKNAIIYEQFSDFFLTEKNKQYQKEKGYLFFEASPNSNKKNWMHQYKLKQVDDIEKSPFYNAYLHTNRFLKLNDSIFLPIVFKQDLLFSKGKDKLIYTLRKEVSEKIITQIKLHRNLYNHNFYFVNIEFEEQTTVNKKGWLFSLKGYNNKDKQVDWIYGHKEFLKNKTNRFLKLNDSLSIPVFFYDDSLIKEHFLSRSVGGGTNFLVSENGEFIFQYTSM